MNMDAAPPSLWSDDAIWAASTLHSSRNFFCSSRLVLALRTSLKEIQRSMGRLFT